MVPPLLQQAVRLAVHKATRFIRIRRIRRKVVGNSSDSDLELVLLQKLHRLDITSVFFEPFPAEWHAGHVWTISRSHSEAGKFSELTPRSNFSVVHFRPSNLGLFRIPFQRVAKKTKCTV